MPSLCALILVLSACSDSTPVPAQLTDQPVLVSTHWVGKEELRRLAITYHHETDIDGFSIVRRKGDAWSCDIYVGKPERLSRAEQELLGHEFAHCLFGAYHP